MTDLVRPVAVYKDGTAWRWACRVAACPRSDWRGRHREALADGIRHLDMHRTVGFRGKG